MILGDVSRWSTFLPLPGPQQWAGKPTHHLLMRHAPGDTPDSHVIEATKGLERPGSNIPKGLTARLPYRTFAQALVLTPSGTKSLPQRHRNNVTL